MSNAKKEIRVVLDCLREQGWKVSFTRNSHWKCQSPDGRSTVYHSSSQGAYSALANWKSELRRAGARIK